jgi:hypothetical protein
MALSGMIEQFGHVQRTPLYAGWGGGGFGFLVFLRQQNR